MTIRSSHTQTALWAVALTGALLSLPQFSLAAARSSDGSAIAAQDQSDATNAAKSKLNKSQFKSVQVDVDASGIATLTGTVDLFQYKADAAKRVAGAKGISAVRNRIEVAGPSVSDQELQSKLVEKLQYDRVGFGNAFNAIGVNVQNGTVTLNGHARTPMDKDSALALVGSYPGVKDVADNIEVDPASPMDDQTRMQVARAVYGFPALQKYAINPARPIRISVQNGNVELYGVVDSNADKELAYARASEVPGVFSVKNYLAVAGQSPETTK